MESESGSGDFNDKLGSDQLNLKSKNENQLLRKRNHQIEDSLNGFPVEREQLPGFSFIMILICRLRNEYWTFWGFLWGAGELGQRYSFDGWRGACGAYLRHRGSNRVTIDVLPGRPMGPLTLLIIGSITMPHTAQHSQKKKHFLHWIIDWENFPLSQSWIVRIMNTGLLTWCLLSFFYSCVLICFNLLKWYL